MIRSTSAKIGRQIAILSVLMTLLSVNVNSQNLGGYHAIEYYKPLNNQLPTLANSELVSKKAVLGRIIKDPYNATVTFLEEEKRIPSSFSIYYERDTIIHFHGGNQLHYVKDTSTANYALWLHKKKMWLVYK